MKYLDAVEDQLAIVYRDAYKGTLNFSMDIIPRQMYLSCFCFTKTRNS